MQLGGAAIHAPRHSFTKRSFGRDLMNIPASNDNVNTGLLSSSNGKAHLFNVNNTKVSLRVSNVCIVAIEDKELSCWREWSDAIWFLIDFKWSLINSNSSFNFTLSEHFIRDYFESWAPPNPPFPNFDSVWLYHNSIDGQTQTLWRN
jgi:hypothetical protein